MAKQLIAIRLGFYAGERIRAGQEFTFDDEEKVQARKEGKALFKDGEPVMVYVRAPKWAMPADNPAAAKAAIAATTPTNGDTKPVGAQKAAAKRARGDA